MRTLNILGNVVSKGEIRPNPDQMKALYDLPHLDPKSIKMNSGIVFLLLSMDKQFLSKNTSSNF